MSKALLTRLAALEERHEGQEPPRPAIVGIHGIDGVIRADMPHPMEPETFSDEAALEARADELGLRCICVQVVDGRRGATCAA